ncbi:MAG: DUF1275 domain-containing protein [Actinomycetota bacterium]|nr:DUF1275 domain-containing protein [Actinomycetota bacterium]
MALTAATGCVDAVSYLGLGQVFTANMTGNLVVLGLAVGKAEVVRAGLSVVAFAAFAAGVLAGAWLARPAPVAVLWPAGVNRALLAELAILCAFLAGWLISGATPGLAMQYTLVVLSAAAMGVQSALTRRIAVAGVATTYITGTLTAALADLGTAGAARSSAVRAAGVLASLVAGAAAGAALMSAVPLAAPAVAVLLVAGVLAASHSLPRGAPAG